jgi:ribosomal protein S18 acetylase RimI-like enzyme
MIDIKVANLNDLQVVQKLAHETWPSAYLAIVGKEQLDYMLEKIYSLSSLEHQFLVLKHRFIVVRDNEIPVGFASYAAHENSSIFHLNKIYVLPGQQGKNLGKLILDYVIADIKRSEATTLQLNVNRHNKAIQFYEKQGFKIIRKEDIDIGSGYFMNDYVMELTL